MSLVERLNWLFDQAADREELVPDTRIEAFRLFLLFHLTAESWSRVMLGSPDQSSVWTVIAGTIRGESLLTVGLTLAVLLAIRNHMQIAILLAAVSQLGFLGMTFPNTANHIYLELLCCIFLIAFDPRQRKDYATLLLGLRWVTVILFFYAGLQKVLYGYYFNAEYLAVGVSFDWRFAAVLQNFLSVEEFQRLRAIGEPYPGSGPYTVESWPFLLLSNASYLAEMLLAAGLIALRVRVIAVAGTVAFMMLTQMIAHEFFFGGLFVGLVLLFAPPAWSRWGLSVIVGFDGLLLLIRMRLGPDWFFN